MNRMRGEIAVKKTWIFRANSICFGSSSPWSQKYSTFYPSSIGGFLWCAFRSQVGHRVRSERCPLADHRPPDKYKSSELIEQRLGLFQVERLEALAKPTI